jgi:hypothetical protein
MTRKGNLSAALRSGVPLRVARKLFGIQVRAHDFELRIDSHRELEQRIGITYLLEVKNAMPVAVPLN